MDTINSNVFLWSRIMYPDVLPRCRNLWWSTAQWQVTELILDVWKTRTSFYVLYVHGIVRRNSVFKKCPTRCNCTQFICKLLYMFRVVSPPIIGSTSNCIYSMCTSQPLWLVVPNAVDTVVCATDDGWRNHPKHVEEG